MYSLNDMDRLLEIKDYISEGYNIAAIKRNMLSVKLKSTKRLVKREVAGLSTMIHGKVVFGSSLPTFGHMRRP